MRYLMIFALMFAACGGIKIEESNEKTTDIREIIQRSGINTGGGGEVFFEENNVGGHQQAQRWLIHTNKEVTMPEGEGGYSTRDDAAEYLTDFQKLVPRTPFGELKSGKRTTSIWENKDGGWHGTYIMTSNGCYLNLEWVKQN